MDILNIAWLQGDIPALLESVLLGPHTLKDPKKDPAAVRLPGQFDDHLLTEGLFQEAIHQDCPLHSQGQQKEVEGHAAPAVSPQRRVEEAKAKSHHDGHILED